MSQITPLEQQRLIEIATKAMERAYAPYSQFRVGAAVLLDTEEIFWGCNVENASYGLSVCAERNAIANAIIGSQSDKIEIGAIAIVNSKSQPCSPCGACRQVIREFGRECLIIYQGDRGWHISTIEELLPADFSL